MPYPLRHCEANMTYHTISRCIEKKPLMKDSSIKDLVEKVLIRTQERYSFELISYTIMDNHFHFVIRTVEFGESISRIMQYIKARIAEAYNKLMNRTGPFWNERFKDIIVEAQENPVRYLLWLLWYLAFNPVKAGVCSDPRAYRYSSINCYIDEDFSIPVKITLHPFFKNLGENFLERVKAFLFYEEAYRKRITAFI